MNLKLTIFLLLLLISSGCRQLSELTKAKPVEIDGLGSLQSVKDKQLNKEQLTKLVKAAAQRNIVNEDDASSMLELYRKYAGDFLNASAKAADDKEILSTSDVENYLALVLHHQNLREEVNLTTQEIITREISSLARFEADTAASSLNENIGNLAGDYVNAYNKAVAKDQKERRAADDNQQAENKFNLISGFEQAALKITDGKKENKTLKEKENARQFLNDLKEYNESLPANAKILDANGRLISPSKMSDRQKDSMEDIFQGSENQARRRLSDRMQATYDKLLNSTARQVKGLRSLNQ